MVARQVRDRDSSDTTETPDFGGGEEHVAPGPIVGADGPTEPEEAPEGGAEAAEAAESEEAGDGPEEPEEAPGGGASRPERVYELDCAKGRSIPKGNHRKWACVYLLDGGTDRQGRRRGKRKNL